MHIDRQMKQHVRAKVPKLEFPRRVRFKATFNERSSLSELVQLA
jgi:hypothetical protein